MRSWIRVLEHAEPDGQQYQMGVRDDGKTFFVRSPMTRANLDTFLRNDCTCALHQPRCAFHQKMFEAVKVDMETESV